MRIFISFFLLLITPTKDLPAQGASREASDQFYYDKGVSLLGIDFDSSRYYFELAQPIAKENKNWPIFVDCYNGIGFCYYFKNDFRQFQEAINEGLKQAKNHLPDGHPVYIDVLNNYGVVLEEQGLYLQALEYFQQSAEAYKKEDSDKLELVAIYQNMASLYRSIGDFDEGINYSRKTLQIQLDSLGPTSMEVAQSYMRLGHNYRDKEEYDQSLYYYYLGLEIFESLNNKKRVKINDQIYCYHSLAKIHLQKEAFDSTQYYLSRARSLQKADNAPRILQSFEIEGDLAAAQGRFSKAISADKKAYHRAKKQYGIYDKHKVFGRTLYNQARHQELNGNFDEAANLYSRAITELSIGDTGPQQPFPDVKDLLSKIDALDILEHAGGFYSKRYRESNDLDQLQTALGFYNYATRVIREMRKEFNAEGSKNLLARQSLLVFEKGIETAMLLYDQTGDDNFLEQAFHFAEQNKARLLEESLQDNLAKITGGLTESELEQERLIGNNINILLNRINEEKSKTQAFDPEMVKDWESQLFELKNDYNELIQRFEKQYPEYYASKYAPIATSVEQIRAKVLSGNQAMLEFFVGSDKIYLFSITNDALKAYSFEKTEAFVEQINSIRSLISTSPFNAIDQFAMDCRLFKKNAHAFHLDFLQAALEDLPEDIGSLIIIPDDILAFLPFELLILEYIPDSECTYALSANDYLFEKYPITYHYSAGLLVNHSENSNAQDLIPFQGFAPSFGDKMASLRSSCTSDEVYSLQCSAQEVDAIQKLIGGHTQTSQTADLQAFTDLAGQCRILHLATHACIDEENPNLNKIYFTDGFITGLDLSNLKLHAELAVLSACNTGSGKLVKGEGVMSLSRGFTLSGCPSTLMSLWSVDDCTTSSIMVEFYKKLKAGQTKDVALQQAKLTHLERADRVTAHPYYWATFVFSGNPEAMEFANNRSFLRWSGVFLLLALLVFYFLRKRTG